MCLRVRDEAKTLQKWPPVSSTTTQTQRTDSSAALNFTPLSLPCWLVFHKLDWECRARKLPKAGGANRDGQRRKEITEQRKKKAGAWSFGKLDYGKTRGREKSERGNDPTFVFPKLPKTGFSPIDQDREGRRRRLAVFCHHGVSGVNTGLTWRDRCWLLALQPGSGDTTLSLARVGGVGGFEVGGGRRAHKCK